MTRQRAFAKIICFCILAFLLLLPAAETYALTPVDGTFRLRALKDHIDDQMRSGKYASLKKNLSASLQSPDLIEGQTEIGFQVYNFAAASYEYRPGRLMATGRHCYIFVETAQIHNVQNNSPGGIARIAQHFDEKVFPTVEQWFGRPHVPEEFGLPDERVFIFLVDIQDSFKNGYVAGYFDHRDLEGLWGNQKPVFFMDINPGVPGDPQDKRNPFYRTLAHELQHMVNFSRRHAAGYAMQQRWLDEGFAMFSEYVYSGVTGSQRLRYPPTPHLARFLEKPVVNIISNSNVSWFHEDHLFQQYGASFLFVAYLAEKYGGNSESLQQSFMRELIMTRNVGAAAINEMFEHLQIGFAEIFCNFILALYIDDPSAAGGLWGFKDKTFSFPDEAEQLPLKMIRHNTSGNNDSYMGSNGAVLPNAIAIEEIAVPGNFSLELKCDGQIRPAIAQLLPDKVGRLQFIDNSTASIKIEGDLSDGRRFFILPLAFKELPGADETYSYSFRSQLNKILIYPLPHPVFSDQFMIFLKSFSGPISPPPILRVAFGNIIDSPKLQPVDSSDTIFLTHYKVPGEGHGHAFCHYDDFSCSFSFSAMSGKPDKVQVIDSGMARLAFSDPSGSIAAMVKSEKLDTNLPAGTVSGPHDILIGANASASLYIKSDVTGKTGLARISDNSVAKEWIRTSVVEDMIVAPLSGSGRYYLLADNHPPVIQSVKVLKNGVSETIVKITALDDISGVDFDSVSIEIDGKAVHSQSDSAGQIHLSTAVGSEQLLCVTVSDRAGNAAKASVRAVIVARDSILAEVFPNPAKNRSSVRITLSPPTVFDSANLRILDSAGATVRNLPLLPKSADSLQADWDLKNNRGKPVANGVYFFRASMVAGSEKVSRSGKISVLR